MSDFVIAEDESLSGIPDGAEESDQFGFVNQDNDEFAMSTPRRYYHRSDRAEFHAHDILEIESGDDDECVETPIVNSPPSSQEEKPWSLAKIRGIASAGTWEDDDSVEPQEGTTDGYSLRLMRPGDGGSWVEDDGGKGVPLGPIKFIDRSQIKRSFEIRFHGKRANGDRFQVHRNVDRFEAFEDHAFTCGIAAVLHFHKDSVAKAADEIRKMLTPRFLNPVKTPKKSKPPRDAKASMRAAGTLRSLQKPKVASALFPQDGEDSADEVAPQNEPGFLAGSISDDIDATVEDLDNNNTKTVDLAPPQSKCLGTYGNIKLAQLKLPPDEWLHRPVVPEGVQVQKKWYLETNGDAITMIIPVAIDQEALRCLLSNGDVARGLAPSVVEELQKLVEDDLSIKLPISFEAIEQLSFFTLGANHNAEALREILKGELLPKTAACFSNIHVSVWRNLTTGEAQVLALKDNAMRKFLSPWFQAVKSMRGVMKWNLQLTQEGEIQKTAGVIPLLLTAHPQLSRPVLYRCVRVAALPNRVFALVEELAQRSAKQAYMKSPNLPGWTDFVTMTDYKELITKTLESSLKADLPDLERTCMAIIKEIRSKEIHNEMCRIEYDRCRGKLRDTIFDAFKILDKDITPLCKPYTSKDHARQRVTELAQKKSFVFRANPAAARASTGEPEFKMRYLSVLGTVIELETLEKEAQAKTQAKEVLAVFDDATAKIAGIFAQNPSLAGALKSRQETLEKKRLNQQIQKQQQQQQLPQQRQQQPQQQLLNQQPQQQRLNQQRQQQQPVKTKRSGLENPNEQLHHDFNSKKVRRSAPAARALPGNSDGFLSPESPGLVSSSSSSRVPLLNVCYANGNLPPSA